MMSIEQGVKCNGCGEIFPSRNSVFKHLYDTEGSCLSKDDYQAFRRQQVGKRTKLPKVLILFGYLPYNVNGCNTSSSSSSLSSSSMRIRDGQDAGEILLKIIHQLQKNNDNDAAPTNTKINDKNDASESSSNIYDKINRSYGNNSRNSTSVEQDKDTATLNEVIATRLHPIGRECSVDNWLDRVQDKLDKTFQQEYKEDINANDYCKNNAITPIRILGRQDMPNTKFNAEMDVTFRRVEYLIPVDMFTWSIQDPHIKDTVQNLCEFAQNHKHDINHVKKIMPLPNPSVGLFMLRVKKVMKLFSTRPPGINSKCLVKNQNTSTNIDENNDGKMTPDDQSKNKKNGQNTNLLKRRRYHNFTQKLMAHEYLAYRRIDRIYHRSTMHFPMKNNDNNAIADNNNNNVANNMGMRYINLSISGDLFLTGQVCRIVGVLLAIMNGTIDKEFVECVFDENYPHLIPTPPAPFWGMISSEIQYSKQEGKTRIILSPRVSNQYTKGWNNRTTLHRVKVWQDEVYKYVDSKWKEGGRNEHGRLVYEQDWTEKVLLPWAEKAKVHLDHYKCWKLKHYLNTNGISNNTSKLHISNDHPPKKLPSFQVTNSVNSTVPEIFTKVVYHLRKLDESGMWPTTSPKRQLVMISTLENITHNNDRIQEESLSVALAKAKRNSENRVSPYKFAQGHGGASGSFSVGIMPGIVNKQPKANSMFPELVKAAFELELSLFPEREPSSTIAINRNAQFRPHTDSGAGAGQSSSLIIGLGTYTGGELMVEGDKYDIRYKGIEFDGWKQRHWTLPFVGERYSLVYFTPKGCEDQRGIDLDI